MSYGTYLITTITYNKETFNSLWQVREAKERTEKELTEAKRAIHELAVMTEPERFMSDDEKEMSTPYEWVSARTRDLLEEIEALGAESYRLMLLEDEWNSCHDDKGKPIAPPKDMDWECKSYICGDFLEGQDDDD